MRRRRPADERLRHVRREVEVHRSRLSIVAAAQRGIFADGVNADQVLLSVATWALAIVDCDTAFVAMSDGDELVSRSVSGKGRNRLGTVCPSPAPRPGAAC